MARDNLDNEEFAAHMRHKFFGKEKKEVALDTCYRVSKHEGNISVHARAIQKFSEVDKPKWELYVKVPTAHPWAGKKFDLLILDDTFQIKFEDVETVPIREDSTWHMIAYFVSTAFRARQIVDKVSEIVMNTSSKPTVDGIPIKTK